LQADRIKIEGSVTGDINAEHGKVTIEPTSRVNGKVRYKQIALNGGKHKMSLEHVDDGSEARD
jgi:cytoskeletal protein CcmA (bactofilin family)